MSDSYMLVCVTCKTEYPHYFASASGFHRMKTPFRDHDELRKFEDWLELHERHDIRILWEQDELRESFLDDLDCMTTDQRAGE